MSKKWIVGVVVICILVAGLSSGLTYILASPSASPFTATVTVTSASNIKVYWDSECTNPVTSIDFGNLVQGGKAVATLYLKNEGENIIYMMWNSDISAQTDGNITDRWDHRLQYSENISLDFGTGMHNYLLPGEVLAKYYKISVTSECPTGTYGWSVTV